RYPEGENQPFKYAEDGSNQALSFGTDSLIHEVALIGSEQTYSSFDLTANTGSINNCTGDVVNQLGELIAFVPSIQWQGTPVRDQVAALTETGETGETAETPTTTTTTTNDGVYVVKAGDTVFTIAQALGVDWQTIVEDNNLVAPYTIYVNQQLIVPNGGEVTIYTVVLGDSLTTIGEQFGLDWSTLAQANGIGWPYWVYPGQELIIPDTLTNPA
ncbi:MAG: LysM peptidoglycan-binding domain-containing protein, partial [Anaerolineales bacterium]|nr:LysM peptidoglycan-binding domain-containing protein [Anaerolineales bacterium]